MNTIQSVTQNLPTLTTKDRISGFAYAIVRPLAGWCQLVIDTYAAAGGEDRDLEDGREALKRAEQLFGKSTW